MLTNSLSCGIHFPLIFIQSNCCLCCCPSRLLTHHQQSWQKAQICHIQNTWANIIYFVGFPHLKSLVNVFISLWLGPHLWCACLFVSNAIGIHKFQISNYIFYFTLFLWIFYLTANKSTLVKWITLHWSRNNWLAIFDARVINWSIKI